MTCTNDRGPTWQVEMNLERHTCIALFSLALASFWSDEVSAAPGGASCQKSLEQGRELVRAAQLRHARAAFAECTRTTCDGYVLQQCRSALIRLEEDTPSVVFVATVASGAVTADAITSGLAPG